MSSPIAPIGALRHSIHQSAGVASRALGSRQDPRAAQRDSAQASASASRPSSVMEPSVAAGGGILPRYGYSAIDARLEGQITNIRIDGDWLTSVQEEGRVAGKWWEEWLTGPITAPAAALPDAVGRQITLPAIRDGQVIEVDSVSDAFYAHNYAAIRAALLTRVPSD